MKSVLTLVEAVEIAWEIKKHKFWTFSIGYLSLYSKSQIILDKKILVPICNISANETRYKCRTKQQETVYHNGRMRLT